MKRINALFGLFFMQGVCLLKAAEVEESVDIVSVIQLNNDFKAFKKQTLPFCPQNVRVAGGVAGSADRFSAAFKKAVITALNKPEFSQFKKDARRVMNESQAIEFMEKLMAFDLTTDDRLLDKDAYDIDRIVNSAKFQDLLCDIPF